VSYGVEFKCDSSIVRGAFKVAGYSSCPMHASPWSKAGADESGFDRALIQPLVTIRHITAQELFYG
jgi:hypothetical protein